MDIVIIFIYKISKFEWTHKLLSQSIRQKLLDKIGKNPSINFSFLNNYRLPTKKKSKYLVQIAVDLVSFVYSQKNKNKNKKWKLTKWYVLGHKWVWYIPAAYNPL